MAMWTAKIEGGPKRVNHAAAAVDHQVFSFGGYCSGFDFETPVPMDVHVFNTLTYKWKKLPAPTDPEDKKSTPYRRYGHTAIAKDFYIYIWGGRDDSHGACNKLFRYNTRNHKWKLPEVSGKVPGPRDGHSACLIKDSMYIFAGFEEETERFSSSIFAVDLNTYQWSEATYSGTPASYRDFHTSVTLDDRYMVVFGGRCDASGPSELYREYYCNKLHFFDTDRKVWFQLDPSGAKVKGRRSHSAFVYNNKIYIFGGYNSLTREHMKDLLCFDSEFGTWLNVGKDIIGLEGPCARRRQVSCLVGSRVFIFGGTSPSGRYDENDQPNLLDHHDLHILDFQPSLRIFCMHVVLKYKLDTSRLPRVLREEIEILKPKESHKNTIESETQG
ncbi:DgyrCDS6649 [Dimorphilus gyrociliatus]|uniref:DgyrCDS6649 n=1 Tax=Dimorphilus gyrociliatus TaxID=2664684 RepID=A0A7I8VTG9_9ANNE|nr:DgyrCDS6649 [Dimorphilus gyrociliatus]